jgi:hypothetical protein
MSREDRTPETAGEIAAGNVRRAMEESERRNRDVALAEAEDALSLVEEVAMREQSALRKVVADLPGAFDALPDDVKAYYQDCEDSVIDARTNPHRKRTAKEDRTPEEQGGYMEHAVEAAVSEYGIRPSEAIQGAIRKAIEAAEPFIRKQTVAELRDKLIAPQLLEFTESEVRADVEAKLRETLMSAEVLGKAEERLLSLAARTRDPLPQTQVLVVIEAALRKALEALSPPSSSPKP